MYLIDKLNNNIQTVLKQLGFDDEVSVVKSSRPELGDYQYNGVMKLAGMNRINPRELAEKIVAELSKFDDYTNINIAGPGFINISFKDEVLIDYINEINNDFEKNIYKDENDTTVFLDYGGANVAKELHVGHLRSANIGEALKRLLNACKFKTISDVHLGDWGRPMGLVMLEIEKRQPDLVYFDKDYTGEYPTESPVTAADLAEIYPYASSKSKEDPEYLEEARDMTLRLQNRERGIYALWKHVLHTSVEEDIKKAYELLNTSFDLWEGESDADDYIPELIDYLEKNNYTEISEGAEVIFVNEPDDKIEIPPFMIKKSNGGVLYDTTELATLYSRIKRFKFNDIWYLTDSRQSLHFVECFRAAKKTKIVPEDVTLTHLPFGTMNGPDGKPFKTRDGGVMSLNALYKLVYDECYKKLSDSIAEDKREETARIIAIAAIKFADLLPNRTTDYTFDPVKFSDLNGKTGPYLLYNTVRIKSIFQKVEGIEYKTYNNIGSSIERDMILHLIELSNTLKKGITEKLLNEICEYLFKLTNLYNTFYADHYIVSEEDKKQQESWLVLSDVVLKTNMFLLNILGIDVPERM
jgi:arginyl-tRNA synthetase